MPTRDAFGREIDPEEDPDAVAARPAGGEPVDAEPEPVEYAPSRRSWWTTSVRGVSPRGLAIFLGVLSVAGIGVSAYTSVKGESTSASPVSAVPTAAAPRTADAPGGPSPLTSAGLSAALPVMRQGPRAIIVSLTESGASTAIRADGGYRSRVILRGAKETSLLPVQTEITRLPLLRWADVHPDAVDRMAEAVGGVDEVDGMALAVREGTPRWTVTFDDGQRTRAFDLDGRPLG